MAKRLCEMMQYAPNSEVQVAMSYHASAFCQLVKPQVALRTARSVPVDVPIRTLLPMQADPMRGATTFAAICPDTRKVCDMTGLGWIGVTMAGALAGWIADTLLTTATVVLSYVVLGIVGALMMNTLVIAAMGTMFGGLIGHLALAAAGACILIGAVRILHRWA